MTVVANKPFKARSFSPARLTFEHIRHRYADRETIRDVSLSAEPGEILCLLGPSGSCKTTLLRIAAGIETQTSGRVLLNDMELSGPNLHLPPEKRGIGLMFQDFALFPHLTIKDNICFGLKGWDKIEANRAADAALERVGLSGYAHRYPHVLSGGEQQRVALARALAPRPAVLLMDEPFSGLDSRLKDSVRADTLSVLADNGTTAVIVTHDAEEAMGMADKIALLRGGVLVQTGAPQELYRKPSNLFAAGFFSQLNILAGKVVEGCVETPFCVVQTPGLKTGTEVSVAVRLSAVKVSAGGAGAKAEIVHRRYLGAAELLDLRLAQSKKILQARIAADILPQGLCEVSVSVNEQDIYVFEKGE